MTNESIVPEPFDLTGVRILIVEDSWHVGIGLKSLLGAMGAEVAGPVATAAEAEQVISELTPDVGIVDFNLRGGERAHDLIDSMNARGIPVIVLSGYSTVPLADGKAVSILQKPVVETQLISALRAAFQQRDSQ